MIYLMEINPTHYSWLIEFYKANPIPKVRPRGRATALVPPQKACMYRAARHPHHAGAVRL
jgi:hypothetical protein